MLFTQTLLIALIGLLLLMPFAEQIAHWLPGNVTASLVRWTLLSVVLEG
ncbi:hypothetical protein PCI56_02910 [Plesiomonas shigelloides subsp. oncorhynchi]|nr:hypothetical protein [Plesiomonas shigelloides]